MPVTWSASLLQNFSRPLAHWSTTPSRVSSSAASSVPRVALCYQHASEIKQVVSWDAFVRKETLPRGSFVPRSLNSVISENENLYGHASLFSVSRILHHIHPCLIYEAIMRHLRDKYEAIMKQISIFYTKNEVLGAAIFVHCQINLKL